MSLLSPQIEKVSINDIYIFHYFHISCSEAILNVLIKLLNPINALKNYEELYKDILKALTLGY